MLSDSQLIHRLWVYFHVHQYTLRWLSLLSILTFGGTLILIPLIIIRIPENYFSNPERHLKDLVKRRSLISVIITILKNCLGIFFLLTGIVLLFLPGQGLLTILIGLLLLNFPGKYRLERYLINKPAILNSINDIRARFRRPPIKL